MNYKAKCIESPKEKTGLMFIEGNTYQVRKCDYQTLYQYVVVSGEFNNAMNERKTLIRVLSKELCQKYLKIV